tara:strand:- start:15 stop:215 length:201 start_codon:yes stop_codon:yes gene_type:complete
MKEYIKISNVKDYNNQCKNMFEKYWFHQFNKNYGYVLHGYNCNGVARDFAEWYKTKKQCIKNKIVN